MAIVAAITINTAFIVAFAYMEGRPWRYDSLEGYLAEAGFDNANLPVALPQAVNNQVAFNDGYLNVDLTRNASSWHLLQWNADDPIVPDGFNGSAEAVQDPMLGDSIFTTQTSEVGISIFKHPAWPGHVYKLRLFGGVLTSAGGRNLFLSTAPTMPIPLAKEVFLNLSVDVAEMRVNGSAPENVVQVFIGMVLKCWNGGSAGDGDTLFMQGILANTHGNRFYAAGNPSIQCGLYANLMSRDLLPAGTGTFTTLLMHVNAFLRDALPRAYTWIDGVGTAHKKTYADRDQSHWHVTEIYVGLETQGDALGIVKLAGFAMLEGHRVP